MLYRPSSFNPGIPIGLEFKPFGSGSTSRHVSRQLSSLCAQCSSPGLLKAHVSHEVLCLVITLFLLLLLLSLLASLARPHCYQRIFNP
ncbi:hypothetical protein BOTBODRAFT_61395 [Botryobasidium botryosum FD-172 SS1]|uniref:Uncharacterized protein n=1 Tax=Botryobasidium botryosum (strain FD-172 SS1) TaxID=930990 RepID=A0A067NDD0_BOTB1|nr:hypothetical protein BOTBODRAFT_61395 [Botryobasidium botryosum FD-172 SS1]